MTIWIRNNIKAQTTTEQSNIMLTFDSDVDTEVKRAIEDFLKWIEAEYVFPQKVTAHFYSLAKIEAEDGEMVSATCFLPYDKNEIPHIKVSTGDYSELVELRGKDNALAGMLHSLAHELTHYFQWIKDIDLCDKKMEAQAIRCADYIIYKYACTREHP